MLGICSAGGLGHAARRRMNPAATDTKPAEAGSRSCQPALVGLAQCQPRASAYRHARAETSVTPNASVTLAGRKRPWYPEAHWTQSELSRTVRKYMQAEALTLCCYGVEVRFVDNAAL